MQDSVIRYIFKGCLRSLAVLFLLVFNILSISAQEMQSAVIFRGHTVNFGKVREGKTLRTRITFKNISQEIISIDCVNARGVKSRALSCNVSADKLAAGDSGEVTIILNADAPVGRLKDSFLFEIKKAGGIVQNEKIIAYAQIRPSGIGKTGPVILFENTVYDLEKIETGHEYACTFSFRNTGDEPLVLNIKPESDSLRLDYPKTPIAPGSSSQIKASFIAYGNGGLRKYISVGTNMRENKGIITLVIKGKISK
jgi:hypothetical protein